MDFRNLSVKELEENFNPRESVPNFASYLSTTLVKSQKAKILLIGHENIEYGNGDGFAVLLQSMAKKKLNNFRLPCPCKKGAKHHGPACLHGRMLEARKPYMH